MNFSLNIALNDLRVYFSDRSNWFSLLVLPIVLTFMLGVAFQNQGSGSSRVRVDLLDLDNSPQSQQFVAQLRETNTTLYFCPTDQSEETNCDLSSEGTLTLEEARQRVQDRNSQALIVIPSGYGAALENGQPVQIQYASLAAVGATDVVSEALNAVIQRANIPLTAQQTALQSLDNLPQSANFYDEAARIEFGQNVAQRATEFQQAHTQLVGYTTSGATPISTRVPQGFGQSIPGMGSMFVMFTIFVGVSILIKERKQWTLQRLVVLPLPRANILGGKVLFLGSLGIMQYVVVFAVAVVTGTSLGNDLLGLALTMLSFVFCITALTLFLSTVIKTQQQADGITLLVTMTLAPLGGAWWPLEIVPDFMRTIGHLSPVAWAMDSYRSLIFYNGTFISILPNLAVLVVAGAILFWLGVRRFSYE